MIVNTHESLAGQDYSQSQEINQEMNRFAMGSCEATHASHVVLQYSAEANRGMKLHVLLTATIVCAKRTDVTANVERRQREPIRASDSRAAAPVLFESARKHSAFVIKSKHP